jgi:hypothetical protein
MSVQWINGETLQLAISPQPFDTPIGLRDSVLKYEPFDLNGNSFFRLLQSSQDDNMDRQVGALSEAFDANNHKPYIRRSHACDIVMLTRPLWISLMHRIAYGLDLYRQHPIAQDVRRGFDNSLPGVPLLTARLGVVAFFNQGPLPSRPAFSIADINANGFNTTNITPWRSFVPTLVGHTERTHHQLLDKVQVFAEKKLGRLDVKREELPDLAQIQFRNRNSFTHGHFSIIVSKNSEGCDTFKPYLLLTERHAGINSVVLDKGTGLDFHLSLQRRLHAGEVIRSMMTALIDSLENTGSSLDWETLSLSPTFDDNEWIIEAIRVKKLSELSFTTDASVKLKTLAESVRERKIHGGNATGDDTAWVALEISAPEIAEMAESDEQWTLDNPLADSRREWNNSDVAKMAAELYQFAFGVSGAL